MRKRLLNDLQKEAPFRESLKNEVIEKAHKRKSYKMPIMIMSSFVAVFALILFLNLQNTQSDSFTMNANSTSEPQIESVKIIQFEEFQYAITPRQQLFMKDLYNNQPWESVQEEHKLAANVIVKAKMKNSNDYVDISFGYDNTFQSNMIYTNKGKLELTTAQLDLFSNMIFEAMRAHQHDMSFTLFPEDIESYQHRNHWHQNDRASIDHLKEILSNIEFEQRNEAIKMPVPDGEIYLYMALDGQFTVSYWINTDDILIKVSNEYAILTGDIMYLFMTFLLEDGINVAGVREITDENEDLFVTLTSKLETLPKINEELESITPNFILLWNRQVYMLTATPDDKLYYNLGKKGIYQLDDFRNEIGMLRQIAQKDLSNRLDILPWEKSKALMEELPNMEFKLNGGTYKVWHNSKFITKFYEGESYAAKMDDEAYMSLRQYLRELSIQ